MIIIKKGAMECKYDVPDVVENEIIRTLMEAMIGCDATRDYTRDGGPIIQPVSKPIYTEVMGGSNPQ